MFTMDIKQQHNPHPDKDLPNDSRTNIHSNNVRRHDSSPKNKHPQSVAIPRPAQHKTHCSSLFLLPRIKFLRKQGTEDDLINAQYDLHYELLLMSVPRRWDGGGEERFRWYSDRGMFVEMDRGGF